MFKTYFLLFSFIFISCTGTEYLLPVNTINRKLAYTIELTKIGDFGLLRKARPKVPAHLHTGIDIKRPSENYFDEPIFPIYEGVVISKRQDGPYAQLIIEHDGDQKFWTVYEHIAEIKIDLFDYVDPDMQIARFMNKHELDKYGWQFNHIHFEILKIQPIKLKPDKSKPERFFASYSLTCYTIEELNKYFYNPLVFFENTNNDL